MKFKIGGSTSRCFGQLSEYLETWAVTLGLLRSEISVIARARVSMFLSRHRAASPNSLASRYYSLQSANLGGLDFDVTSNLIKVLCY